MSDANKPPDAFAALRGLRDAYLDAWSKVMIDAVNTDAYAEATGTMLDAYLTASTPFRDTVEKATVTALQQLNMPTRQDVVTLAERLTHVEMRLDDMDEKLDRIERLLTRKEAASPTAGGNGGRARKAGK